MDRVTWWADSTTSRSTEYSNGKTGSDDLSSPFTTLDIYNARSFTNDKTGTWSNSLNGAQTYTDEDILPINTRTLAANTSFKTDSTDSNWLNQMSWGGPNAITMCSDSKVGTLDGLQLWYGDYDEVAGPSHGNL